MAELISMKTVVVVAFVLWLIFLFRVYFDVLPRPPLWGSLAGLAVSYLFMPSPFGFKPSLVTYYKFVFAYFAYLLGQPIAPFEKEYVEATLSTVIVCVIIGLFAGAGIGVVVDSMRKMNANPDLTPSLREAVTKPAEEVPQERKASYCPNCRIQVLPDSKFCSECGQALT